MGGKLTVMLAGADNRLKAAAPSCGGVTDRNPKRTHPLNHDDVSLERIDCPIFFLSPANDFHGRIDDLQTALAEINSPDWRITCAPHHDHQDTKDYEVATQIWFDQVLRGSFQTPETPRTELNLQGSDGIPELRVFPDTTRTILDVEVFLSRDADKNATDRFWHYAPATKQGDHWVAPLQLYGHDKPVWVYANVRYQLDEAITGAGYYYGIYTSDRVVLSSKMSVVSPEKLQQAGVQPVLQPSGEIEDFTGDWQKQWFIYGNHADNWRLSTRKLGDELYAAPDYAKLALSVRAEQDNILQLKLGKSTATVKVAGGGFWQDVQLYPMDFKDADGVMRSDWKDIHIFQFTDEADSPWQGAAPEFQKLHWVPAPKPSTSCSSKTSPIDSLLSV